MALPNFTNLHDLAVVKNGGNVLFATDDWFAEAENMLKVEEPVWKEAIYTPSGKWMDGWETRRKRTLGHDWCIIKLGFAGQIKGIEVNTAYFTGNFVPQFSLQAAKLSEEDEMIIPRRTCKLGGAASEDEMTKIAWLESEKWQEIIPMTKLKAGYKDTCHNFFHVDNENRYTHIRLNAYPDGGIARLRVYGTIHPDWNKLTTKLFNLIGMENGAQCINFSNAHYGHPRNLTQADKSTCMSDGWETARQPNRPPIIKLCDDGSGHINLPGSEWAIFKFGCTGIISAIDVDTAHFIGNSPLTIELEGAKCTNDSSIPNNWERIFSPQKIIANSTQTFNVLEDNGPFNYVKVTIVPDGGISRIRIWGKMYNE